MKKGSLGFFLGFALPSLALDLASKRLVQSLLLPEQPLPVLPGLRLNYVLNPAAAFSLFLLPERLRLPFFGLVTLGALTAVGLALATLKARDRWMEAALGLVASGALGNLADRWRFGRVVDFIEVGVPSVYTWPVFNVADSAVCVGVGILVWKSLFSRKTEAAN
jgi:signal peptidase II